MSDKPKRLPRHIRVGIVTTAPSNIYQRTTINEVVDIQGKESMKENQIDLKTKHSLTVDTLSTLKGMRIRDPTTSVRTVTDYHYKTHEKRKQEDEIDWRYRIKIGKPFEKYKLKLINRLEKFSSV